MTTQKHPQNVSIEYGVRSVDFITAVKPHLILHVAHVLIKNDFLKSSSECIHIIWNKMRALTIY